jgi:RING-type zinc-finger/Ankyrin repeats (many copies)
MMYDEPLLADNSESIVALSLIVRCTNLSSQSIILHNLDTTRYIIMSTDHHEGICSICLEKLNKPVKLPCNHSFCTPCLDQWRSKYSVHDLTSKKCPQCRANLPPTREMVAYFHRQLKFQHHLESLLTMPMIPVPKFSHEPGYNDQFSHVQPYLGMSQQGIATIRQLDDMPELQQRLLKELFQSDLDDLTRSIDEMKHLIGDDDVDLENLPNDPDEVEDLPKEICHAIDDGRDDVVLEWLGKPPVPAQRINGKYKEFESFHLLHFAAMSNRLGLMTKLLQLGADVNATSIRGLSPLELALQSKKSEKATRLLLTWGANKSTPPRLALLRDMFPGNEVLMELLESDLGGRRCEIVGLEKSPGLNGKTGVATQYLPHKDRYVIQLLLDEPYPKAVLVRSTNLKRRDYTTIDDTY